MRIPRLAAVILVAFVVVFATFPHINALAAGHSGAKCVVQKPQASLIRGNYLYRANMSATEASRRTKMAARALRYRTEKYGYVDGFMPQGVHVQPASSYSSGTSFMGLPLHLNRKIIPAVRCVQDELRRACTRTPYQPKAVGGFRDHNTYRHGEVSNHMFGIAIDIDPDQNPCCGCVEPWPDNPRCTKQVQSVFERMDMPSCWVRVFEKYGFYWLGHDDLQDTMHFEFLGNPDLLGQ